MMLAGAVAIVAPAVAFAQPMAPTAENCENMLNIFDMHLEEVTRWDTRNAPEPWVALAIQRREDAEALCADGEYSDGIQELQQGISVLTHAHPQLSPAGDQP
jgi:hypothetical protein